MSKKINLCLETNKGIVSIPFIGIKEADLFTVEYNNRLELLDSLIRVLSLPINKDDVGKMYLSYIDRENIEFDYETCFPVKYSKDNYNVDSLIANYSLYLKEDQSRLNEPGVRNVGEKIIFGFKPGYVKEDDINLIAKVYLKDDYKKIRDTYFMICDDYSVKIDKVSSKKDNVSKDNLFQLESNEDDYLQYLIELSSRGGDEFERAMDELSKIDLEDIKSRLDKSYYGVLDGLSNMDLVNPSDIRNLEEVTGISINELRDMCMKQINNGRGR